VLTLSAEQKERKAPKEAIAISTGLLDLPARRLQKHTEVSGW